MPFNKRKYSDFFKSCPPTQEKEEEPEDTVDLTEDTDEEEEEPLTDEATSDEETTQICPLCGQFFPIRYS